jgi:hypothetical protein
MFSLAKLTLAMAAGAMLPLAGGCDDAHKADKRVLKTIEEARVADAEKAQTLLTQAAAEANAAAATKAYAKAMLAQAEVNSALARISDPEKGIEAAHREIARLVWEIDQLGQHIQTTNVLAANYSKFEPKEARAAVAGQIAAANGSGDKPNWIGEGPNGVPTLAAITQQVNQFQGEVAKQEAMIQQLQAARQQKAREAEQAARQAEATTGPPALQVFKVASGLRKDAADLANQIEVAQAKLAPVQQDLALAQARQAAVAAAVDQLQKQQAQLEEGWKAVQAQVLRERGLANAVLNGGNADAKTIETIKEKAAKLAKVVHDNDEVEKAAEESLTNAIQHYEDAATAARQLALDAKTATAALARDNPMKKALDTLTMVYDENVFRLGQANAKLTLANLLATRAQTDNERVKLAAKLGPIVREAGLQLPAGLEDPQLAEVAKKAAADADTNYDDAMKTFLDVSAAANIGDAEKGGGRAGHVYALYGRALLGRSTGNDAAAKQHFTDAQAARDQILQENKGGLPVLPAELVVVTASATTAPTTAPAAAPATAPGETPATAPAETPASAPAPAAAP